MEHREQATRVGTVHSLWRYPVKSMRGECVVEVLAEPDGIAGDRRLAFASAGAAPGKPLLTGAERTAMLRCRAKFRAASLEGQSGPAVVEVCLNDGRCLRVDDPALIPALQHGLAPKHDWRLVASARPLTDCRPIALLSVQTLRQLTQELGTAVDAARFRANILLDLEQNVGFGEDAFVGRRLRFGKVATILIKERDPRCRVITLDPATGESLPALMTQLARAHEGRAGIYGAAVDAGRIAAGDSVWLLSEEP